MKGQNGNQANSGRSGRWRMEAAVITVSFLCILVLIFSSIRYVNAIAIRSCFDQLDDAAERLREQIVLHLESEQLQLQSLAQVIGYRGPESATARSVLASFEPTGIISRIELVLPDSRVLDGDSITGSAPEGFDFDELAEKGGHISQRVYHTKEGDCLYICMPVEDDNGTAAVLLGIVLLRDLPEICQASAYDGRMQVYIADGETGDFLVDTWHDTLGNVYDLGNRETRQGKTIDEVNDDLKNSRSGTVAFLSSTAGEYFYAHYLPLGINNWQLMVSVAESDVFVDARDIAQRLYLLAAGEGALLVLCFGWLLYKRKKEARMKEKQLGQVRYMLDVEKLLLNAPREAAQLEQALRRVADYIDADSAFLLAFDIGCAPERYLCRRAGKFTDEEADTLTAVGAVPQPVLLDDFSALDSKTPGLSARLQKMGVRSLMAVPICGPDNAVIGTLGAVNPSEEWTTAQPLESVSLSFSLAYANRRAFLRNEQLSSIDTLTALKNRNQFQKALARHEQSGVGISCIYIDADGLHELNNSMGHAAGDQMLRDVAGAVARWLGEDTYRIGGDEFVAFSTAAEDALEQAVRGLQNEVSQAGYHISVGTAHRREYPLMNELVAAAEQQMYRAKRKYYREKRGTDTARSANEQLERMLKQKNDLEVFREAISSRYEGVYLVDLQMNAFRSVHNLPCCDQLVRESGGRFTHMLEGYCSEQVAPFCRTEFAGFADNKEITRRIRQGEAPQLVFQKTDGSWVAVSVRPSPAYSEDRRETVWLFEKTEAPSAGLPDAEDRSAQREGAVL